MLNITFYDCSICKTSTTQLEIILLECLILNWCNIFPTFHLCLLFNSVNSVQVAGEADVGLL